MTEYNAKVEWGMGVEGRGTWNNANNNMDHTDT